MIKIKHVAHACFVIENDEEKLIIDPFDDSIGYPHIKEIVNYCLVSHNHYDHNYIEDITINPNKGTFKISSFSTYHDNENGSIRGNNLVYIIETKGVKLVHLGDLGHILNEEQLNLLQNIDILMIPVGGTYTIDASMAIENIKLIKPKNIIPMHYKTEFTHLNLETPKRFVSLITELGYEVVNNNSNILNYDSSSNKVYILN